MTDVERQPRLTCDHVARSRLRFNFSHRRYQTRDPLRDAFHGADPLGRARYRVTAKMHRRCAGMVGAPHKGEFQSALSCNRIDHAERQIQSFQNWPLFDMKLKVTQRVFLQLGLRDLLRIQPKLHDRLPHRDASRIANAEEFVIQSADQRTATNERSAEAYAFLFRKANHLDRKG